MEGKKNKSRAILVFGTPCSGKTTFCESFAKRFHAPFYNLDDIMAKYDLTKKQVLGFVEEIAKTGQTLVFEGFLNTEKDREKINQILKDANYAPSLIWIQTDSNTTKQRMKMRLKSVSKAKTEYGARMKLLEAPSDAEPAIVISGRHTFDTQLKHVLTQL
ncbi:AAA family ATPase [Candidatus Saccharibacteria bacterium]|nr:AAA family ATPase [Candidatus Saccharibacteria bacterium]